MRFKCKDCMLDIVGGTHAAKCAATTIGVKELSGVTVTSGIQFNLPAIELLT